MANLANQADVQKWMDMELDKARKNSTLMDPLVYQALVALVACTTISYT